ncbi:hypothetical protein GH714_019755 [Hevea brasiliensis]|uniref:Uncharacterized protein n=1 Tax=Hevea brasiliensis TaxID=3981 RepID=A0A6A6L9U6_HEVBR|nr:hypothetical protein GH714_019755 [Hevea brasiliensis]
MWDGYGKGGILIRVGMGDKCGYQDYSLGWEQIGNFHGYTLPTAIPWGNGALSHLELAFGECLIVLIKGEKITFIMLIYFVWVHIIVKYVNPITKLCIIRTSREEYQKVWSAITMVRSIGNCPVLFNLLDLSGSIKACKSAALKCDELKFEQYKLVVGDRLSEDVTKHMQNCLEKIKILEH